MLQTRSNSTSRIVAHRHLASAVLSLVMGCSSPAPSTSPTEAQPASTAPGPVNTVPDGPTPPMYKPSSSSKSSQPITDNAYGAYKAAPSAPAIGDVVADFEVPLADGGMFRLADARKAGPVLIMFYRGFW